MDLGYFGAHALTMDGKGRIAIPAKLRDGLATEGSQFTLTKHPDGCVLLLPATARDSFLAAVSTLTHEARAWRRTFLGFMSEVGIDTAGRVLVDPVLRDYAGLDRDTLLIGVGSHFELWDKARYAVYEASEMGRKDALPECMKSFAF